jgi:hypothetical protein
MATRDRVISRSRKSIGEADSIDAVVEIAKQARSGRDRIDRVSLDPSTGDLRAWRWGAVTKFPDGRIELDVPRWVD